MQNVNDSKRFLAALCISILVAFVYMQYVINPEQQAAMQAARVAATPEAARSNASAPAAAEAPAAPERAPSLAAAPAVAGHPSYADLKSAKRLIVENDKFIVTINELGGRVESVLLKGFTMHRGQPELLDLVHMADGAPLPLAVFAGNDSDDRVVYRVVSPQAAMAAGEPRLVIKGADELGVDLEGVLPDGTRIEKHFGFHGDSYLFDMNVALAKASAGSVWLEWSRFVPQSETGQRYDQKDYFMLDEKGKLVRMPGRDAQQGLRDIGKGAWISISDQYFMATLLPEGQSSQVRVGKEGDTLITRIRGGERGAHFKVFTGPKVYEDLEKTGFQLEKNVDMGLFSFLAYPILLLVRLFYALLGNWGLAIILLTLVLKIAFLPLTSASFKSMKAMQEIQPEVQALRERIDDATKLNQELMALYKRRGVNPMGGCLPVLIQIPVFLGLYNALLNAIELRHAPFALWINDLSAPERLEIFGIGIPLMILLMGASMLIQQWTTPTAMDPAQKKAFLLMPVMFTGMFIVFPMPSGLVLYWLINNVISIVQQQFLRKEAGMGPWQATMIASVAIFVTGYVLILI